MTGRRWTWGDRQGEARWRRRQAERSLLFLLPFAEAAVLVIALECLMD